MSEAFVGPASSRSELRQSSMYSLFLVRTLRTSGTVVTFAGARLWTNRILRFLVRKNFVNFSMNNTIHNLTRQLSETMEGEPWIDETFSKKLSGLPESQIFTRPLPDVHSVAEIISHILEWRYSVLSILKGGSRTLTVASPSNWKDNETLRKEGWTALKEKLYKSQQDIITFLEQQDDNYLQQVDKEGHTYLYYVEGLIHHDMYHLGQIGLVIKMLSFSTR